MSLIIVIPAKAFHIFAQMSASRDGGSTTVRLARKRRPRGVVRGRPGWHARSMDAAAVPAGPSPRTFTSRWEAAADIAGLWMRAPVLAGVYLGRMLDPQLREQVMVAVSRVNACAGCSWVHERWALRAGVSAAELEAIGLGDLARLDDRGRAAVIYGAALAENRFRGIPDRELVALARRHLTAAELRGGSCRPHDGPGQPERQLPRSRIARRPPARQAPRCQRPHDGPPGWPVNRRNGHPLSRLTAPVRHHSPSRRLK